MLVNSNLRAGKSGNPIVASSGEREILLHELGHSLFGLADEYCCDGGYWEAKPIPNIFESKQECERVKGEECHQIGAIPWWHSGHSGDKGLMEALEKSFFDDADSPAVKSFLNKYLE